MGMSCLIRARETDRPQTFIPPDWAYSYPADDALPNRDHTPRGNNFWWIELGGEQDCIHDTEEIRDELLKVAFGIWDHIKNHGDHRAENLALEWVGFLPGKRESRRYLGDHLLTQNDLRSEGRFDDIVAYGGWPMDDHNPAGMDWPGPPTIFHGAPSPFGIPYRCLYSRNVNNLFFAGRNISVTHAGLSSTRVMATCAIIGQAVGTAAALAREVPELTKRARVTAAEGDAEALRNGVDRPVGASDNGWTVAPNGWVQYSFDTPVQLRRMRFVFDSNLNRNGLDGCHRNVVCYYPFNAEPVRLPSTLVRKFRIEVLDENGAWRTANRLDDNYHRLVWLDVDVKTKAVRFVPEETWASERVHLFAWDIG